MGIVASLASVPVSKEVYMDELRRERERREDIKYGRLVARLQYSAGSRSLWVTLRYQHGDADLAAIKKIVDAAEATEDRSGGDECVGGAGGGATFREGLTDAKKVENVYLTGLYREKYKYMNSREASANVASGPRKPRSAYPTVRF